MEDNKPEDGAEKALPRGLEQVSHLFLSNTRPASPIQEASHNASTEETLTAAGDEARTLVLRPLRSPGRSQLISLLRQQTSALEDGIRAIDSNIPCCEAAGNIELLALDRLNQLTIIDMDENPNDSLLLRGFGHFDWIVRHIPIIRRMYQEQMIDFSLQPRLILVAPEFSPLLRSAARHARSLQIDCLKYHTIALAGGSGIFFEHVFGGGGQHRR